MYLSKLLFDLNSRRPLKLMMTPERPRLLNMFDDFVLLRFWARVPEDLELILLLLYSDVPSIQPLSVDHPSLQHPLPSHYIFLTPRWGSQGGVFSSSARRNWEYTKQDFDLIHTLFTLTGFNGVRPQLSSGVRSQFNEVVVIVLQKNSMSRPGLPAPRENNRMSRPGLPAPKENNSTSRPGLPAPREYNSTSRPGLPAPTKNNSVSRPGLPAPMQEEYIGQTYSEIPVDSPALPPDGKCNTGLDPPSCILIFCQFYILGLYANLFSYVFY